MDMDHKDIASKATSGGLWFAATTFTGQLVSWFFTFYVIRLLDPKDFGMMTMASLLTAYLQMFSELGLGAAIIQQREVNQRSLSSAFWLLLGIGVVMGGTTLLLAYPTAWIFSNEELIPITQLISILFIVGALSTVPYHLLAREFQFKTIGLINLVATLISSALSVTMALNGYGVYALIWTTISLSTIKATLFFIASRWRPSLHYAFADVRSYLSYGIVMALSGTSLKLYQTLDKLVIGRFFGETQLGLYQNAINISSIALDKIWPLFQQVLFPLFSRLREDKQHCNRVYLETLKNYLLVVSPIYLGSAIVAEDLILVVLGEKWLTMTPLFQVFCIVKLFQVLTAYHVTLDTTTGMHKSALFFNFASALLIPGLMWVGAYRSFDGSLLPWISAYPALCIGWLTWSLRKNGIGILEYLRTLTQGFFASIAMSATLLIYKALDPFPHVAVALERLLLEIGIAAVAFALIVAIFQRPMIISTVNLIRNKQAP